MSSAPQKSTSVTAVKGHLVNKSSPLATDSCKLEKQFITAQNMASHYKRVINAKPTIDTSAPGSLTKSIKAKDRAKKEMMRYSWANKNPERAKSAETPRSVTEDKTESKTFTTVSKTLNSEIKPRVLPDQQKLNKSMSNMMINFTKRNPNRVLTYRPKYAEKEHENKSQFVNPMASSQNLENQEATAKKVMASMFFNSSNDHNTSGILNPALKAMSRLVSGHNYDVIDIHAHKFKQPTHEFQPRIKNIENSTSKLKESNCYEPPRRAKKVNISQKNQENLSQNQKKEEQKSIDKSRLEFSDEEDFGFNHHDNTRDKLNNSNILNISSSSARRLTSSQTSLKRAAEKEEELKYLEFIKDVTDDILQRNLTTDRVIRNCFNYHLKKNKNRLDEKKMRELLDTLREDIGIPKEGETEIGSNYYQTVNKAILLDKERNKENNDQSGTEYLTLRKFGYTSLYTSGSLLNNEKEVKVDLNSSQVSQTRKMFDDYENQIIKNIQTIRRKSTDSSENEKVASRKNSITSEKSLSQSPKQSSILKKSSSQSPLGSRKSSDSKSLIKQESNETKPKSYNFEAQEDGDDDDDGDIFLSSKHSSKSQSLNNSRKNSLVKQSFSREDFEDEDALFNNNYGELERSENSEDDDNFDELIKTQAFKKNRLRKKSTESNSSDINEKSRSFETPTPRPRISKSFSNENKGNQKEEMSDEDDF